MRRRAERVIRPTRAKTRRLRVLVITVRSPRPIHAVQRARFAFVVPAEDRVRIGFEWGADLPDPSGLLEGKGKQVRYVTVRTAKDLDTRALADLLTAAAAMPPRPRRWG